MDLFIILFYESEVQLERETILKKFNSIKMNKFVNSKEYQRNGLYNLKYPCLNLIVFLSESYPIRYS